jgi:hypothetical protein
MLDEDARPGTRRRSLRVRLPARASHQMRSRPITSLIALVLLGALAVSPAARAHPGDRLSAASAAGSHLRVTEVEYRLLLSRGIIKAGPVNLETIDRGLDPHDLRLRALASGGEIAAPQLEPGQHWKAVVDLKPGIYRLWCSLPEHARLGMHTTLTVVR